MPVLTQRAGAWFSRLSRKVKLHWPVDLSVEYKYASGTGDPRGNRSAAFDQLYAANPDRLGHEGLFEWRYDSWWLAAAEDSLYNGQDRAIVRSARGDAGTHVGRSSICL